MKLSPTNLLLAPVGAGKTESVLDLLLTTTREQPFAKVWVLLATRRQIQDFRQRMISRSPARRSFFNIEFFDFYTLYRHLLDSAGKPQRCLDEPARLRLLREILRDLVRNGELELYSQIAGTPGFVRIVSEFIYELKQNVIFPEKYAAAGRTIKDDELARIYAAYQTELRKHNLVDREGEGWLALEAVEYSPLALGADVDLLLVDGYDQFNPLQVELLTALAARAGQTLITLTTVPGREETVGRRFETALERLKQMHQARGQRLKVHRSSPSSQGRHPALCHLLDNIFVPQAARISAGDGVRFIEAPDAREETAAVLREVKSLLLDGANPERILIAIRDWPTYAAHIPGLAQMYDLQSLLALQSGDSLEENPAIRALFDLLELSRSNFRRRELMDALRSPYFELKGLDGEWIEQLDRVSRALFVTAEAGKWLEAVRIAPQTPADPEDETSAPVLTAEAAKHLEAALDRFFQRITPPEEASVSAYVRWLEMLIGSDTESDPEDEVAVDPDVASLNMIGRIRKAAGAGIVERDLTVMDRFKGVLRAFLSTQELFEALGRTEMVTWDTFWADLKASINRASVERAPGRDGRVLVTTVTDGRGLPHDHVFVLGLSEGVFPAKIPEDPLYLDNERAALTEREVELQTRAGRADDDGLFYELISLARESVTLSRTYIKEGAPWPASHLWRAALNVFDDAQPQRIRLGAVTPPERAACLHEAALSVADALNAPELTLEAARVYNWLLADDETANGYWMQIRDGCAIEMGRLSRQPYDRFTGRLNNPGLIDVIQKEWFSPTKAWSASQLNEYGVCPYRYYAGRILGLEVLKEPEDGMNVLQAGSIQHAILEKTYTLYGKTGQPINEQYVEEAVGILRDVTREVLRDAPKEYGFQPSALWEQEKAQIERRLESLIRLDFSPDSPLNDLAPGDRHPYRLEKSFGMGGEYFAIPIGGEVGTLRVAGKIDRIDRVGNRAVVVDYKSGTTEIKQEELERGRNFQMMLYLLAAQHILAKDGNELEVSGGLFLSIRGRRQIGSLKLDEAGQAVIDRAREHLSSYITRGRGGDFASHANKIEENKCSRYCEFHALCRVSNVNRRKRQD